MVSYTNQKIGAPFPVVLNVCCSDSLTSVCFEDVPTLRFQVDFSLESIYDSVDCLVEIHELHSLYHLWIELV